MTQAILTFDQATLGAGLAGAARTDGVPGQLVTITASDTGGGTYTLELLSMVPTTDAAPTLVEVSPPATGARQWTFTPPAGLYGRTYRFRLIVDAANPAERSETTRIFAIRGQGGTRFPAPGETASPDATIANNGADQQALSEDNEGANVFGWNPDVDLAMRNGELAHQFPVSQVNDGTGTSRIELGYVFLEPGDYEITAMIASPTGDTANLTVRSVATVSTLTTLATTSATLVEVSQTITLSVADSGYIVFDIAGDVGGADFQCRFVRFRRTA